MANTNALPMTNTPNFGNGNNTQVAPEGRPWMWASGHSGGHYGSTQE
jgi:hypothetical protein